jgi:hypothetical protein
MLWYQNVGSVSWVPVRYFITNNTSCEVDSTIEDISNYPRVNVAFGIEYACGQRLDGVIVVHGNAALINDRPGVVLIVHEVHATTSDFHAGIKDRLMYPVSIESFATEKRQE